MQRHTVAVYTCAASWGAARQQLSSAVSSADRWPTAFDLLMPPYNPTTKHEAFLWRGEIQRQALTHAGTPIMSPSWPGIRDLDAPIFWLLSVHSPSIGVFVWLP